MTTKDKLRKAADDFIAILREDDLDGNYAISEVGGTFTFKVFVHMNKTPMLPVMPPGHIPESTE